MCVVSMIGDHYRDRIGQPPIWPQIQPWIVPQGPEPYKINLDPSPVTREELELFKKEMGEKYDELKKMMEEAKALLIRAKEYDEKNNEPNCEMDEKVAVLKRMAELVGVDLSQVFK